MNDPVDPTPPLDPEPDADPQILRARSRRRLLFGLGAALVVGGVAVGVWAVVAGGTGSPVAEATPVASASALPSSSAASAPASASPSAVTPSASASAVAPPAPVEPADGAPTITRFTVEPAEALCPDERASTVPLTFAWDSEGGERAWIGAGTTDASLQPTAEVALSAEGYADISFACSDADQVFALTVTGPGGTTSSTIAVPRLLE